MKVTCANVDLRDDVKRLLLALGHSVSEVRDGMMLDGECMTLLIGSENPGFDPKK
jgi:hypothetical protein